MHDVFYLTYRFSGLETTKIHSFSSGLTMQPSSIPSPRRRFGLITPKSSIGRLSPPSYGTPSLALETSGSCFEPSSLQFLQSWSIVCLDIGWPLILGLGMAVPSVSLKWTKCEGRCTRTWYSGKLDVSSWMIVFLIIYVSDICLCSSFCIAARGRKEILCASTIFLSPTAASQHTTLAGRFSLHGPILRIRHPLAHLRLSNRRVPSKSMSTSWRNVAVLYMTMHLSQAPSRPRPIPPFPVKKPRIWKLLLPSRANKVVLQNLESCTNATFPAPTPVVWRLYFPRVEMQCLYLERRLWYEVSREVQV